MEPSSNRPLMYVTGVVAVGITLLTVLLGRDSGRPYVVSPNVRDCRARYAAAKTAADSMRVDVQFMRTGQINSRTYHSGQCGELRYSGQLGIQAGELPPPPRYTIDTERVLGKSNAY
jgi:hypothetical protein